MFFILAIPCRPLIPTIKNAQPPSQKKQLYRSGETIEVQCENGYRGIGNATWECNEGNWTSTTDFYCQSKSKYIIRKPLGVRGSVPFCATSTILISV